MFAGISFTVIVISFVMAKTFLGLGVLDGDEITTVFSAPVSEVTVSVRVTPEADGGSSVCQTVQCTVNEMPGNISTSTSDHRISKAMSKASKA